MLYTTRYQRFSTLYKRYLLDINNHIDYMKLPNDVTTRVSREGIAIDHKLPVTLLEAIDKYPTKDNQEVTIRLVYRIRKATIILKKTPSVTIETLNLPENLEDRIKSFSRLKK